MGQFSKNYRTFYQKIVKKLLKIWSWDPGSEIRDPGSGKNLFRIPGSKSTQSRIPDPGSGSATLLLSINLKTKETGFGFFQKLGSGLDKDLCGEFLGVFTLQKKLVNDAKRFEPSGKWLQFQVELRVRITFMRNRIQLFTKMRI